MLAYYGRARRIFHTVFHCDVVQMRTEEGVQTTASSVRTIEQTRQDDSRGRSTDNDRIRRWRHSSLTWASSTRRHVIMSTIGVDSALARPSVMSKVSTAHKMATTGGNMPEWMRRRRGTIWHHESRETDIAVAHRARHSDVRPLTSQTRVQPFAVVAGRRREIQRKRYCEWKISLHRRVPSPPSSSRQMLLSKIVPITREANERLTGFQLITN